MDEQAPGSVCLGLGLGSRVGSAVQTGPGRRSALRHRKAYRRNWERTAFSCSLDKKDVLMVISVSRARFSCSQSCQRGHQKMDQGRAPQLPRKKTNERRAEENKVYFHGYQKNTFGQRPPWAAASLDCQTPSSHLWTFIVSNQGQGGSRIPGSRPERTW